MNFEQQVLEIAPNMNPEVLRIIGEQIKSNTDLTWNAVKVICGMFAACFAAISFLTIQVYGRATYKWLEEQFQKKIDQDMKSITKVLVEIKDALTGTMDRPGGFLGELENVRKDVERIKCRCSDLKENR